MKRLMYCFSALLMISVLYSIAAAQADFSGTWTMDKTKSKGIPRRWESAEKVTLVVKQDATTISVDTKMTPEPQGRGGPSGPVVYKLDGTPTVTEGTPDRPMKSTFTCKVQGKSMTLTTVRKINMQGEDRTMTTTEIWTLADDGSLMMDRKADGRQGPEESKLVFTKNK